MHQTGLLRRFILMGAALAALGWSGTSNAATAGTLAPQPFRLTLGDQLPMLRSYSHPSVETPSLAWRFAWGPWGVTRWGTSPTSGLRLTLDAPEPVVGSWMPPRHAQWGLSHVRPGRIDAWSVQRRFGPNAPLYFGAANVPPAFWSFDGWTGEAGSTCERTLVRFTRYQAETDAFALLDCDGSVSADAIDRLSIMARPPGVPKPPLPLPDEPSNDAAPGEWLPSLRLLSPRLVWLVHEISEAYPNHGIYIVSGYRTGPHEGVHAQGRALDLQVMGVSNERVYRTCRTFRDVGCGFYPNHAFVHVDVRAAGTGSRYWIDVSEPGHTSEYVASWPGLENGRGATFDAGPR